jgi:uncharacterized membrane protein
MGIVLGLAAALLYGSADFGGGLLSRRMAFMPVTVIGSAAATVLVWVVLIVGGGQAPSAHAIAWGLISGLGGGIGTLALYRGLSRGQMSVVGPISAVGSAVVPVVVGVALGERPSPLAMIGVVMALPAIALAAANGTSGSVTLKTAGVTDGLVAGAGFGVLFVALAQAGGQAGLWPIAAEQTSALLLVLAVAARSCKPLRVNVRTAGLPILVGVGGMSATLLYFYATHSGMLTTVAVLTSLYPGVTVVLARAILHERFSSAQRLGLALCAGAVAAIALT